MEHIKQMVGDIQFRQTRNTYPVGEILPCHFNILSLSERKPETGDWIGIYPVGWTQLTEFKVRKYISAELIEKCRMSKLDYFTAVFESCELPKETDCSYEFVYVTRSGIVRGVSQSFRFETAMPDHLRSVKQQGTQESTRYPTSLIEFFLGGQYEPLIRSSIKAESVAAETKVAVETKVAESKKEWTKPEIKEEELLASLWQKFMTLPSSQEEQYKLTQELLVENMRLRSLLESKSEEILKVQKSHDELKMVNGDLLSKLNTLEKKIEKESVERENFIRKVVDALRPIMALHPERICEAEALFFPKSQ